MPTPTPVPINYGSMVISLFLQGFIGAIPGLLKLFVSTWYVWLFFLLYIIARATYEIFRRRRLSRAGVDEIDKMSGNDFELFLCNLFSKLGYKVKHTGRIGDLGADLIVEINGLRIAVQAKRYKGHVGPNAIREVLAVLKPRKCTLGIAVANNYFTEEAKFLAKENNITLWERNDLIDNILKAQSKK